MNCISYQDFSISTSHPTCHFIIINLSLFLFKSLSQYHHHSQIILLINYGFEMNQIVCHLDNLNVYYRYINMEDFWLMLVMNALDHNVGQHTDVLP